MIPFRPTRLTTALSVALLLTACADDRTRDVLQDDATNSTVPVEAAPVVTMPVAATRGYAPYGDPSLTTDAKVAPEADPIERVNAMAATAPAGVPGKVETKAIAPVAGPSAHVGGSWAPPRAWPLIAIHAAVLPDGRLMSYGTDANGRQTGKFIYDVWDTSSARADQNHLTLPNQTSTDIFCSSQTVIPTTGQLLINGGDNWTGSGTTNTGNRDANLYSTADDSLSNAGRMNRARWYSAVTTLANGLQYVQGGNGGTDRPEVRQADGTYRLLDTADTNGLAYYYPRNHIAPDGRVFGFDTGGQMYYVDAEGSGYVDRLSSLTSTLVGGGASSAMYEPHRILQISANSNRVVEIDIRGPLPVVTERARLSAVRKEHNSVVLPDGRVIVVGGSSSWNDLASSSNHVEIYDPATNVWTQGPSAVNARLYHSTALLLPDASVLVAGGGAPGPLVNTNAEIYFPPYLYAPDGKLAARPAIADAPVQLVPGQGARLTLGSGGAIGSLVLMRSGSVTHSINFDQRRVPLTFTQSGPTIDFEVPASGGIVPPGYYMLFAVSPSGVPSVARIVNVAVGDPAALGTDWTGRYGGRGGAEFRAACDAGEVLVGVTGHANATVNRLNPTCARVGADGGWIGSPVTRAGAGGTGGTAFSRTCPSGSAVSGFSARSNTLVDAMTLFCRPLRSPGRLRGDAGPLPAIGGAGGTERRRRDCGLDHPATALYGRSGSSIDAIGLLCEGDSGPFVNHAPVVTLAATRQDTIGTAVSLAVDAADPDGDALTYGASQLPPGLTIDARSGLISGTPTATGAYVATITVGDGTETTHRTVAWTIVSAGPDADGDGLPDAADPDDDNDGVPDVDDGDPFDPAIGLFDLAGNVLGVQSTIGRPGVPHTLTVRAAMPLGPASFEWRFGDGATRTVTTPEVTHTWTTPGRYAVSVTVRRGTQQVAREIWQVVVHAPTATPARHDMGVLAIATAGGGQVWTANPDQGTVTAVDIATMAVLAEIPVGGEPRSLAADGGGRIVVTDKDGARLVIVEASTRRITQTHALPAGAMPHGVVIDNAGTHAWVALEGRASVARVVLADGRVVAEVPVADSPRHLAIDGNGTRLLASRFITGPVAGESGRNPGTAQGGEIFVIDTATATVAATIALPVDPGPDTEASARGVPNYVGAAAISPDGRFALVPFKTDNIYRGTMRDGQPREHDRMVRGKLGRIDLAAGRELTAARIDFENNAPPTAAAFDPSGAYVFVIHEASRVLSVLDGLSGATLQTLFTGFAPRGIAVSADGTRVFVHNYLGRSLGVLDAGGLIAGTADGLVPIGTVSLVGQERLSAQVLRGKRLFHDAFDERLVSQRYLSCASCHADGGHDGRTWDFGDAGEGLRNTIDLRGKAGTAHGNVHWSGNFDEIHDFENDIRGVFKGTGLLADADFAASADPLGAPKAGRSADLDALAAYLATLDTVGTSPYRMADGSLSDQARQGRELFLAANCLSCHGGAQYTDSPLGRFHDIGTVDTDTGGRLGGALVDGGLDTPTLRGLWLSAPYLHDGSAPTVQEAIRAHTSAAVGFDVASLSDGQLAQLAAYLLSIDDAASDEQGTTDTDGDGVPDVLDNDDDGDGVPDGQDAFPRDAAETLDTDGDGIGNNADPDDDNDGTPDGADPLPLDPGTGAVGTGLCNRLADGGFENGAAAWASNTTLERVVGTNQTTGRFAGGWISQTVSVPGAGAYVLAGRHALAEGAGWAGFGVDMLDAQGNEIAERVDSLPGATALRDFSLRFSVPAGVAYLRPWFYADPDRTLSLDDVDLRLQGCLDVSPGENHAPVVSSIEGRNDLRGEPVEWRIVAADPDGDPIGFVVEGLPPGIAVDPATGLVTGTPGVVGTYDVRVRVSDTKTVTEAGFAWVVRDPAAPVACDQLRDGGFEQGLDLWQSSLPATYTTDAFEGASARLLDGGWMSIELPVAAGRTMIVEGRQANLAGTGWTGMGIDWVDAGGAEIGEAVRSLPATAGYSAFSLTADAPAGATAMRVWFYADPGRAMRLDDLHVRSSECAGTPADRCNLVANPELDESFSGWVSSVTPQSVADGGGNDRAARIEGGWMTTTVAAREGVSMLAQADLRALGGSGWAGMGMNFVDDGGRKLGEATQTLEIAGATVRLEGTTPAGTRQIQLWFFADAQRSLTFDSVRLGEAGCR